MTSHGATNEDGLRSNYALAVAMTTYHPRRVLFTPLV